MTLVANLVRIVSSA